MELFSEIYGLYYQIVADILDHAPLTRDEAREIAAESGFAESVLHLIPKLLEERTWPLLDEREGMLVSRLRHPVREPVSLLELRWLKAVLADPRARLFLSDREMVRLSNLLFDVPPLYESSDFVYFDRYRDGDNYYSYDYIRHFRRVLAALREKRPLKITFRTGAHSGGVRIHTGSFLPLRLEYSEKDDKFRAHCAQIRYGRLIRYLTINLGRILETEDSDQRYEGACDPEGWPRRVRCAEPIVADVYPERNAIERFLLEFSSFEKRSEFDEETGVCRVSVWYPMPDETELLIRILGFGPTVRVLSPERFRKQICQRVAAQSRLLASKQGLDESYAAAAVGEPPAK